MKWFAKCTWASNLRCKGIGLGIRHKLPIIIKEEGKKVKMYTREIQAPRTPRRHRVERCLTGYMAEREPQEWPQYAEYGARALARVVGV